MPSLLSLLSVIALLLIIGAAVSARIPLWVGVFILSFVVCMLTYGK